MPAVANGTASSASLARVRTQGMRVVQLYSPGPAPLGWRGCGGRQCHGQALHAVLR